MKFDYIFFYTEANIVCIIILGILLIHDRLHSARQEKQIWFDRTLIAHILYFLSDIGWAVIKNSQPPRSREPVILFNFLNYILLSVIAYEWFMYMAASVGLRARNRRSIRRLCLLPMLVSVAGIVIAYMTAPFFWVSENGELNDLYYPMMVAVPILYLLAALVFSMIKAKETESREEKQLFRLIGIYPLGIIVFGQIQIFILNAPLFCFGCTIMMLFFYIQNMQTLVSVDSLTRLNNRGQINRYMAQTRYKDNTRIYIMMIDINCFKEINDIFGHAEGDRALILVSDVLKQTADHIRTPAFLGRYGGDEFTIFIQTQDGDEFLEQVAESIRNSLAEKQRENQLPYELKVSIGYDALRDQNDTMEACMIRADGKLYENKRASGAGR